MKRTATIPIFFLSFFLGEAGVCADYPKNERHPVAICLKELDIVKKDFEKRKEIKKRCLKLAKTIFQKNKNLANQKFLLDAATRYSYEVNQSQNKYFTDIYNKYFTNFKLEGVDGKELEFYLNPIKHLLFICMGNFLPGD